MSAPRVVLDTPVMLRALLQQDGPAARLRQAWQTGEVQLLVSKASVNELWRALAWPALALDDTERNELLADFLPHAEVVAVQRKGPALAALAWDGGADWWVSLQPTESAPKLRARCQGLSLAQAEAALG